MRHRSTILAAALLATLATTACEQGKPAKPAATDWPKVATDKMNCLGAAEVVGGVDEYDIDQDRILDQFVTMRCVSAHRTRTQPGQLMVFKGGTPPDNPTRLGVIVHRDQGLVLTGCVTFAGLRAFTRGANGESTAVWGAEWVPGRAKHLKPFEHTKSRSQLAGCD